MASKPRFLGRLRPPATRSCLALPLLYAAILSSCSRAPPGASNLVVTRAAPPLAPSLTALVRPVTLPASAAADSSSESPSPSASPSPSPPPSSSPPSTETASKLPRLEGGKRAVHSKLGLVVAVETQAARIGAIVLEQGGNAVDAAIATQFALAVTHPSAASLGGEGVALVRTPHDTTVAFEFLATAPGQLTRANFDRMIAGGARGPVAVGVPGLVAGMALLHSRFGTLPLPTLIAPALALAKEGQKLGAHQARLIAAASSALKLDRAAWRVFQRAAAGKSFAQPDLAWTLERLSEAGADDFYRGQIAERLARAMTPLGFSLADLGRYRAQIREPLQIQYRGFGIETAPPPSAGGVALIGTLLSLATFNGGTAVDAVGRIHWLLESEQRAQAERRFGVRDPDTLDPALLSAQRARWQSAAYWSRVPIEPQRHTPARELSPLNEESSTESEHTTHLSVVDRHGMVVSLTTTLCASFGAKVVAAGTGIVLNNAVATFSATGENQPQAGRRTTSSMAPTLLSGSAGVVAVLGTPGGDTIPSTLAQLVEHLIDRGLPLDQAVEAPRWHQGFVRDLARYEIGAADGPLLQALRQRGHRLRPFSHRVGDANCIVVNGDGAFGYADSREPGLAVAAGR